MIRFGLLGCGRISKRHSDLLGGNHIEGAVLVAVCDPLRERVHLGALQMLGLSIGSAAAEVARRASGRRAVPNRSPAHDA